MEQNLLSCVANNAEAKVEDAVEWVVAAPVGNLRAVSEVAPRTTA